MARERLTKSFYLARHGAEGELTDEQVCLNCKLTPASCGDLLSGCEMAQRDLLRLVASARRGRGGAAKRTRWQRRQEARRAERQAPAFAAWVAYLKARGDI